LHLSRPRPHSVRGRLPRAELSGPRAGDVPGALGLSTPGPHGDAGGGGADGALPLLGRGLVHHRPGLPHRRRSAGAMKLIPFGLPGREKPGLILEDGTRIDASAFGSDYGEAFFGGDGLARLRDWAAANAARAPRVAPTTRLGPPVLRPSKIVRIGLNHRDP